MERANTDFFLNILFFDDLRVISDYFLTILSILSITVHSFWNRNKLFWNYDVWSILIHISNSFWFFKIDFWPFYGLFLGILGIVCPWTSYRSHILTQEYLFLKIWSLELYQEISYDILIFDHVWVGDWHMKTCDGWLLRPERSSAARRYACYR